MNSWSDQSPSPEISGQHGIYAVFCWPFFPMRDLWMWGMTPESKNIGEIKCFMHRQLCSVEFLHVLYRSNRVHRCKYDAQRIETQKLEKLSAHLLQQLLPWWESPTPRHHGWPAASDGEWYASPSSLWRRCLPTLVPENKNDHEQH